MRRSIVTGVVVGLGAAAALAVTLLVLRTDEPLPEGSRRVAAEPHGRAFDVESPRPGFAGLGLQMEDAFAWAPDGSTSLVLGGSSSCPPAIESGTWDKETNAVRLRLAPVPTRPCTADWTMHAWTLTVDGETLAPDEITLVSPDGREHAVPRSASP